MCRNSTLCTIRPLRRMAWLVAGLTALAIWAPIATRAQPDRRPTIAVETALVTLSVTVFDDHERPVQGLSADRFTVTDEGHAVAIQFFSADDVPATVGLVIDSSGSMRARRDDVTAAATAFASSSHPLDELFTVNFNDRVWLGLPAGVAFADDVGQLSAALRGAPAEGRSAVYDAIDAGIDHLQLGKHSRKVLIVVSDGGDNASTRTFEQVKEHARRTSTLIDAVVVYDVDDHEADPAVLKRLANETGGRIFEPRGARDMAEIFMGIALEVRASYMIGFSPAATMQNDFRRVKVTVEDRSHVGLIARTRRGYYPRA